MIAVEHRKAFVIQRLMDLNAWEKDRVLLVDDDEAHVNCCRELGTCRALLVRGEGISLEDMERIEADANRWAAAS